MQGNFLLQLESCHLFLQLWGAWPSLWLNKKAQIALHLPSHWFLLPLYVLKSIRSYEFLFVSMWVLQPLKHSFSVDVAI